MSSGRTTAPFGPTIGSDLKSVLAVPAWFKSDDLELLNDSFEPAFFDGAKREPDDEDNEFGGMMSVEEQEEAMLQMAMKASLGDGAGAAEDPAAAASADQTAPSGRPVAFPLGDGTKQAKNIGRRNNQDTESQVGAGFELVYRRKPEAGDDDMLVTHVIVRGPWECSCPLKHAAVWMLGWERGVLAASTEGVSAAAGSIPADRSSMPAGLDPEDETDLITNYLYARSKPLRLATATEYEDRWNSLSEGAREAVLAGLGVEPAEGASTGKAGEPSGGLCGSRWFVEAASEEGGPTDVTSGGPGSGAGAGAEPVGPASGAGIMGAMGGMGASNGEKNHPQDTAAAREQAVAAMPRPWVLCDHGVPLERVCHTLHPSQLDKLGPAFRPHAVVETAAPLFDGSAALPLAPQVQAASLRDEWGGRPMGPAALHLMLASRHRTADVPTFLNIDVATVQFVGLRGERARQAAQRLREHAATGGGSPMEWAAPRAVPRAPSLPSVVRLMPRPGCLQPVQYDFLNFVSHCPTVHLAAPRFAEGTLAWRRWCSALQAAAQVLSKELPPLQLAHDIVVAQRMLAEIRGGTMDHLTTAKGRVLRGTLDEDEGEEGMEGTILDAMPEGAIAGASVSAASCESEAKASTDKLELLGAEGWFPPGVQAGASASAGLGAGEADRAADLKARLAVAEWARYYQPVLRERSMRAGPLFFTTSRTPWVSAGPTAQDGDASSPAAAAQSSGGPATGAGAGGDDSADIDWEAQFVEPWGAPLEPAGSYLERLSNLFDYDLSDSGLGGDDGGVQIEQPDGSVVTLDGTQSVEGDWAVGHMHIWVLVPATVRLNGMVSLRPARYRFRDWELARGDKAQEGGRGAEAPKVDDVVAFVRSAMAGEAPRFHSGEKSGMPRPKVEEEGVDAAGGSDPSIAGSGLVELRLPCEEPQLQSVHWHSDELENQQGEGLVGEGEPVMVLDKHAPGSHWKRMLLAAESMQLLRLVRPMAAPIEAGHDLGDCVRHAVLVATLADSKGDDKLVRSLNLLQAWVNGRMRPGRAALQVVVMMVDRNDVDERAMPHVDSPDIRLFLPRGGAMLLAGEATAPLDPEAAQAAGYDAEHAYDCARPLGGALGRHGWSASPAGWVSAGFLEWWLRSGWRDESQRAVGEAPPHMQARAAARTSTSLGAALPRLVRFVRQSTEAARQAAEGAGCSCPAALAELGTAAASVSNLMVALDADEAEVAAGFIEARSEGEDKGATAPLFPGQELGVPREALEVAAMEGGEGTADDDDEGGEGEGAARDGAEAGAGGTYHRGSYGSDPFLRLAALAAADMQTQYDSLHGALLGLLQQLERREDGSGQTVDAYHQMLLGTGLPPTPEAAAMAGVPFLEVSAEDEVEEEEEEEGEDGQEGGDGEEAPEGVVLAGSSEGEAGAGKAGPGAAAGGAGDGVGASGGGTRAGDGSSSGEVGRVVSALAAACTCGSPVPLGRPGGSMALGLELKRLRQRVEAAGLRWPRSQEGSGCSSGEGSGQSAGDVQWLEDEDHLSAVLQAVGMEEMEAMQRRAMAGLKADGVPGAAVVIAVLDPGSKASMDAGAGAGGSGDALLSQALALVDGATTEGEGGEQAGGVHLYAVDPAEAPGVLTTSGVELSEVPCVMIWGARSQNMKTSQQASHLGVMLAIMRLMGPEE